MSELALPLSELAARRYRPGDAAAIAGLVNRAQEADGIDWRTSADEVGAWLSAASESFTAARDLTLVEADGRPVAYGEIEWVDTTDGLREYRNGGAVDPDWQGRGIGRWVLRHNEELIRTLAATHRTDRPMVLGSWAPEAATGRVTMLEAEGYRVVRTFYDMLRPSLAEIEAPALPSGIELRAIGEADLHRLWDADAEAFADHWGGSDTSEARYQAWRSGPYFDPSLFVVAWDGDEIAGGVINLINAAENEAFGRRQGWLESVFVRRPWRRRGLGKALVLRSLEVFRDRGLTSAGLGVDADNPTGAVGVYQRTGFVVHIRSHAFRKPLEG